LRIAPYGGRKQVGGMKKIIVHLKKRSYPIVIGRNLLPSLGRFLKSLRLGPKVLIVTNLRIQTRFPKLKISLRRAGFEVYQHLLSHGNERDKSERELLRLWNAMSRIPLDRTSTVLALGGGVVGDVSGFAASTYMRGISLVQIPTTLLAQVDSAIGGKTAINLPSAKNAVGTFYQPKAVYADVEALKVLGKDRLGREEFKNSFMEVIKYGMIRDIQLFELLERKIRWFFDSLERKTLGREELSFLQAVVTRSALVKAKVVESDEKEVSGKRMILNYGHTFAHALESASKYKMPHGEAVGMGMILAGELACRMGIFKRHLQLRQVYLVRQVGLRLGYRFSSARLLPLMKRDKKARAGKLCFVLPEKIGQVGVYDRVPEKLVREVIERYRSRGLR